MSKNVDLAYFDKYRSINEKEVNIDYTVFNFSDDYNNLKQSKAIKTIASGSSH